MDLSETKQLLAEYDIRPTRSLGQNFLIDDRVVDRLCAGAEITGNDFILEIGPGLGSLTKELASARAIKAIEIDKNMVKILADTLSSYNNIEVIHADALKTDFNSIAEGFDSVKVAANLPYYITTQLIEKLIVELVHARLMLLMMQKEASDRLFAMPGSKLYGPVSILIALYGKAEKYQKVSAASYYPRPHVDSIVIKLVKSGEAYQSDASSPSGFALMNLESRRSFHRFLNACFSQRRKTFANVIKNSVYCRLASEGLLGVLFSKYGLTDTVRAEQLAPKLFLELFHMLQ